MSGAVFEISSKVLKVFSGLASGSPGPAIAKHRHLRNRRGDREHLFRRLFGRQLLADHAGARFIGAIIFAIAVIALDVAGRRHGDMHAGVVMMRFLAVARMVLHLLPDFRRKIFRAGAEPQLALPLPPLVPQPLWSAIFCMRSSSGSATSTSKMEESSMVAPNEFKFRKTPRGALCDV